jgi:CBS domain containing-hemolysin-like protein
VGVLRYQDLFVRPGAPILAMSLPPARLPARMTLAEALRKVREAAVPVGVVEEDGRPVGFVTVTDLIEPLTGVLG